MRVQDCFKILFTNLLYNGFYIMNKSAGFSSKNKKGKRIPPAMTTHHLRAEMDAGFEELRLGGEIDSKKTSKKIAKVNET